MSITTILFDLDDTLMVEEAAAEAAFLAASEHARERYGIAPQELHQTLRQRARELWHASPARAYCVAVGVSSWEGLWARYTGDNPNLWTLRAWAPFYRREAWARALADHGVRDAALAEELAEAFPVERRARHIVYPDVLPALQSLRLNYRLGLVTNGLSDLQREKIHGGGLAPYFETIIISGDLGFGKPDPRIFHVALGQLNVSPKETVMIGDSLKRDIVGAQQAGLAGIWINRRLVEPEKEVQPDAQIANLSELRDALAKVAFQMTDWTKRPTTVQ